MSRLIKDFGYNEKFGENIDVYADEIEGFSNEPPFNETFCVDISRNFNEERFDFNYKIRAFEDKPGVEITVFGHTKEPKLYTGSIVVDEIEFVDKLYNVVINEKEEDIEDRFLIKAFTEAIVPQLSADGYWLYSLNRGEWFKPQEEE